MEKIEIKDAVESTAGSARGPTNVRQRILVVDDDHDIRQLCVELLADSGYEVEAAKDGAAGWDALQADRYDLVITDNKMPRMTGIEMIAKLRDAKMKLPIIMATGFLPLHQFIRRPWLQPDVAMERPFTNDDLLEVVNKILRPNNGNHAPVAQPSAMKIKPDTAD